MSVGLANGALTSFQFSDPQPIPAHVPKQDWSTPLVPIAPASSAHYSKAEVEYVAPARIRVEHRQVSMVTLSSTRPYRDSSSISALIGVVAGSALLLFAYGFIPLAQSLLLRLRALHLKQDLIV